MNTISTERFYGRKDHAEVSNETDSNFKLSWIRESRKMPSHILGPRQFWMEFGRQADALETAFEESNDHDTLSTFVYQRDNGCRRFVVCHPEVYWWYYKCRPPDKKCSYEVIPENSPCRLYLDLEYSVELNPQSDGSRMTNTLINVFCSYLLSHWGLPCNRYDAIDLDSSTDLKFSRHIIFNIQDVAFKNNYHAGRLVKSISNDILEYVESKEKEHYVLSRFDKADIEMLLVETKKGRKLFVDTAVYTKNRHFRIYKSTKWGKEAYLTISQDCKYVPSNECNDKELTIFLQSLVSYFSNKKDLILLEYTENGNVQAERFTNQTRRLQNRKDSTSVSQYPVLDEYISNMIHPGRIRICKYFESTKTLLYETMGYRYCKNISRCHKSNNVFWIVDLKNKEVYQKCHDGDCAGFKSQPEKLPEEISFQVDEEDETLLMCATIAEDVARQTEFD